MKRFFVRLAATVLPGLLFLSAWQAAVFQSTRLQFLFASPLRIAHVAWLDFPTILHDVAITGAEALLGLIVGTLLGMGAGLLLWGNGRLNRITQPYLMLAGSLPVFALAPVLIIWFGIGMLSKVVLASAAVFLVALQQAYDGAAYASRHYRSYARALGAPHRRILVKIILPGSIDWTIAGFKMNIGFSLIGAFSGEFICSNSGLGHYILIAGSLYDMPRVFFGLGLLSALGFILLLIPWFLHRFTSFHTSLLPK